MSISAIAFTKEMIRQGINQDSNFLQKMTYYFELHIPNVVAGAVVPGVSNAFVFPLVIPPENYVMEEPFATELTPTQRGGLYGEENGIIKRPIRIRGNTGFKPRTLKTYYSVISGGTAGPPMPMSPMAVVGFLPVTKSYSRNLPMIATEISGHRHFQYLQDAVFRTYADLKRDPVTARDTALYFHVLKDDEHWRVIPQKFTLERDKSKPVLYNYNIEMDAVGPADASVEVDFDDKSILDQINNALYMADMAGDLMTGCLDDLIGIQADLKAAGADVTTLIDGLTDVLDATNEFIDGNAQLINIPYAWTQSLMEFADESAALAAQNDSVPDSAIQVIRSTAQALEILACNPESFARSNDLIMRDIHERQELNRSVSEEKRNGILEGTAPQSFAELEALGTALTPGEVTRGNADITAGGDLRQFKTAQLVEIAQGDTLASLAAQYLGDARLWQYLAIANGLKPPFVDEEASTPLLKGGADESPFGQSLGRGSKLIVPSNVLAPADFPILPVLGARLEESLENQLLGTDVMLLPVLDASGRATTVYDIPVDIEHGATDVKTVAGMDNMVQVVTSRITTEHGSDTLYKQVGLKRIIGLNFTLADLANAQYRIRETVQADSRIVATQNMDFDNNGDALQVKMDAVLRGFSTSRPIDVAIKE